MEKPQFTYLIGAGASANIIPIVNEFPEGLRQFAEYIQGFKIKEDSFLAADIHEKPTVVKDRFNLEIRKLAEIAGIHSSIDVYARKLFLSNKRDELIKLKAIISEFLLSWQFRFGIDKRYDAFFAAILDNSNKNNLELPPNIKILSWNYDKQIEYSIAQFYVESGNDSIENFLQVSPRKEGSSIDTSKFCLFKINGSIGGTIKKEGSYIPIGMDYKLFGDTITEDREEKIIKGILSRFYNVEKNIDQSSYYQEDNFDEYPTIMYSWENRPVFEIVRNNALQATRNTEILVIIGYSFPTFNRSLDKMFLQNMFNLEKVFIQSPERSIGGVVQRFKSLYFSEKEVDIEPVTNVEEFYIPFEFD